MAISAAAATLVSPALDGFYQLGRALLHHAHIARHGPLADAEFLGRLFPRAAGVSVGSNLHRRGHIAPLQVTDLPFSCFLLRCNGPAHRRQRQSAGLLVAAGVVEGVDEVLDRPLPAHVRKRTGASGWSVRGGAVSGASPR